MPQASQRWSARRIGLAAWLSVLLVLSGQVRAAAAPQEGGAVSAVQTVMVFCHAGGGAGSKAPVLPHHVHEAAVLQSGPAGLHHAAIAPVLPWLVPPCVVRTAAPTMPQARASPGRLVAAAYPRGPPRLV